MATYVNALLVNNVFNEVLHGFEVPLFEQTLGVSRQEISRFLDSLKGRRLNESASIEVSEHLQSFFRNALALTLKELGEEEFSTRTGVDFSVGTTMLKQLTFGM